MDIIKILVGWLAGIGAFLVGFYVVAHYQRSRWK